MEHSATETTTSSGIIAWEHDGLEGKYLTFKLDEEVYGLQILKVQEIIGLMKVTAVPKTPDYVRGVINLRGSVIPVVELRRKFALKDKNDTDRTCIVVVQVQRGSGSVTTGIIVDEVSEVLDILGREIEPSPRMGAEIDIEFILGLGKVRDRVILLLDVDRVLTGTEMAEMEQRSA